MQPDAEPARRERREPSRGPSLALSAMLHLALIGAVAAGWWLLRGEPPPAPPLVIEASVVDAREARAVAAASRVAASPSQRPRVEPAPQATEGAVAAAKLLADQAKAEQVKADKVSAEKARADQIQAEKAQAERARADRAQADKAQADKANADKAAADKLESARLLAAQRVAEESRLRAAREAELRDRLAAEERAMAARAGGLGAQWAAAIQARIQRAWIRPPGARPGLDCTVAVTQVPGGEVVGVRVLSCNGDATVKESVEAAVYRASPLPPPPDEALFEKNLEIRFKPND